MKKEIKGSKKGSAVAVGAGVIALAAATYFLFGPNGKRNQKKARGWMMKMKGEVVERLEKIEDVTEPVYRKVVDSVAQAYATTRAIDTSELKSFTTELKKNWKDFSRGAKTAKKRIVKTAKKVSKKKK